MNYILKFKERFSLINFFILIWVVSIPFKNGMYQVSTVLIILYFLFYVVKNKDYFNVKFIVSKYKDLIYILLSIIFIMMISNYVNSMNFDSYKIIINYIYRYGLILFVLLYFYSKKLLNARSMFIYVLASLSIQALDGVHQAIYGYDFFKANVGNIYSGLTGSTSNRNIFAFFVGIGLIITFLYNKDKNKYMYLFLSIFTFNVLFAYSRAIWVSLSVSFIVYLFFSYKNLTKKDLSYFAFFMVVLIFIFLNSESLSSRFDQLIAGNSSQRIEIWLSSLPFIQENLFLGHGIDSAKYYDIYNGHYSLHNQTLEILFDIGLIGLVAYLFLLFLILKELKYNKDIRLLAILIYLLVNGIFGESIISSKTMLSTLTIFMFFVFVNRLDLKKDNK